MSEARRPTCSNCGHEIEQAFPAEGEFWGGFADHPDLPPGGYDAEGNYMGSWYHLYWVIESDQVTRYNGQTNGDDVRDHPGTLAPEVSQ